MQSPFNPNRSQSLPAIASLFWDAVEAVVGLSQPALAPLFAAIPAPPPGVVGSVLRVLNSTTGQFELTTPNFVTDVKPIVPTITNTYELGYKGIIGKKLLTTLDVYYSKINDFIGPLRVETPNVFLDPQSLTAYLAPILSNPAFGLSAAQIAGIIGGMASVPVGTIKPNEAIHPADLMLTYRNFGDIDLYGADLSFTYYANANWNFTGTYSYVSKNFFRQDPSDIALNAPKNKIGAALQYNSPGGFDAQLRLRYVDAFPVNSGVYIGETESFTVLDFNTGVNLPSTVNTRLTLTIQNIFDNEHQEFIGAPEIGRLALVRLSLSY